MLKIFYNPLQVCTEHMEGSFSKSPLKPKLVVEGLQSLLKQDQYEILDYIPYNKADFKLAHYDAHINGVYEYNQPGAIMETDLPWSQTLVKSLEYTNACLYNAIKASIENPEHIYLSPTSGYHHARPHMGLGFCTFSGQCIASLKMYEEKQAVGVYIDLDAHFGNSIDDTRIFNPLLNTCIPKWANYNPNLYLKNRAYINDFASYLYTFLQAKVLNNECQYIVYCHGADSIEGDDSGGGKVTLDQWHECTTIFWNWYNETCEKLGRKIPVSLSLFGGYRNDNYQYVIDAHTKDILIGLNIKK